MKRGLLAFSALILPAVSLAASSGAERRAGFSDVDCGAGCGEAGTAGQPQWISCRTL